MRNLVLSLISFIGLASCATVSPNPWNGFDTEITVTVTPIDCGQFPLPSESTGDTFVYDRAAANDLNDYRQCSEANEGIASEHTKQIDQLKIAKKALVDAGRSQRNIADMRQTMLEDERKHHFFSTIGYWVAIIGMGIAL